MTSQELIKEFEELRFKILKFNSYSYSPEFKSYSPAEQARLTKQRKIMQDYLDILDERLAAL